ncbi:hypothetical protein DR_1010 [Deinococcus radiodurans R1 = ATCC 13939 = DSM 20539]|uniref:Uncharacterized protein n=1 Tax=Deinococcus radiodurans (strain ATCC 13939 / DSM 20539 / JCM 16871 / CCUG 27074 / LMG 4051 / NBRC 15346 / NCIMB 9279 / VKM B-1422 / R1) TaxID=243230 RepID=Q9RVL7_DEIRA|nr:hypothetical protein DR_1010 [Deinococcus radiodurans R1 = ATCC 13939 = DSM 20539]
MTASLTFSVSAALGVTLTGRLCVAAHQGQGAAAQAEAVIGGRGGGRSHRDRGQHRHFHRGPFLLVAPEAGYGQNRPTRRARWRAGVVRCRSCSRSSPSGSADFNPVGNAADLHRHGPFLAVTEGQRVQAEGQRGSWLGRGGRGRGRRRGGRRACRGQRAGRRRERGVAGAQWAAQGEGEQQRAGGQGRAQGAQRHGVLLGVISEKRVKAR